MLKARNVLITFVLTYLSIMIVAIFIEAGKMENVADDVNMSVRAASKMALRQAQSVDDAWSTDNGLTMSGANQVQLDIKYADGNNYVSDNMMEYICGTGSDGQIYEKLFNTQDFFDWVENVGCIPTQTYRNVWDDAFNGKEYVELPKIANMGLNFFEPSTYADSDFWRALQSRTYQFNNMFDRQNPVVFPNMLNNYDFYSTYNMTTAKKTSKVGGSYTGLTPSYYVTPSNLNLTYVNEELVSVLFLNNLDLIQRAKFDGELESYTGIPKGSLTSTQDAVIDSTTVKDRYVNNGRWAFEKGLLGTQKSGLRAYINDVSREYRANDSLKRYSNVDVEYKVIDMYDSSNDDILISLYGMKASELKANDTQIDTYTYYETGNYVKPDHRYVIVALCTFKVDICVPYTMPTMRDWAMIFNNENGVNYVDLKRTDNESGMRYEYTTMFAVQ